jgi:hypothetical protein
VEATFHKLLTFIIIQLLDLLKTNKNNEKMKQTPLLSQNTKSYPNWITLRMDDLAPCKVVHSIYLSDVPHETCLKPLLPTSREYLQ